VVDTAVKGAKERGMTCDMIVGSGWPYGGEFVPQAEQSQIMLLGTKKLEGGKSYQFSREELMNSVTPPSNYEKKVNDLFMLRLAPAAMPEFSAGTDLNSQVKNDTIDVNVPAGDHVLYYLVKVTGFQSVIQGALGANGPVINHYEKAAVENYLNHFAGILKKKIGPLNEYFRAFFTDSIELEGANWCHDMFEQFRQRKHYDVEPYFPFILFKVGEMGNAVNETYGSVFSDEVKTMLNRVRFDYEENRVQLFQERFIETFTGWCTKQGVKSRMQAYGMDCQPLDASMLIDIPECETWIWVPEVEEFGEDGKGRNYTMINKFVSSAAHLKGKQLISCEEMTNTGQIFSTSLERIKVTGDQSNLSGVTHSVLHGFNYCPPDAPFPGWIRYGCYFNERNTWWPYFRLWSDYKARISALFQNAVMQADVAVMHPLSDLVSKYGFQRDPFPRVSYPSYVHQVWEAIHQNGNGCDYISEHVLLQSSVSKGSLRYNNRTYHSLLLIEVETILPETAEVIKKFADAGGKVIFVGKTPHLSPGLQQYRKRGKEVEEISAAILKKHPVTTGVVPVPGRDMIEWFRNIQQQFSLAPYIRVDQPVYHVNQLFYQDGAKDIFFFVNYSAQKPHAFTTEFNSKKTAWLWDAETGHRFLYPSSGKKLQITLAPSESRIIVFDENETGEKYIPVDLSHATETVLSGPWQLDLYPVGGGPRKLLLDQLTDLKQIREQKDFSGTLVYHKEIDIPEAGAKTFLSLGHINDVSELLVNGQPLGERWYGEH
ncbi:MAG: glycosyl hydrolase, partial [Puia sp.]